MGEINVPIHLDFTKALSEFANFQKTVQSTVGTDRENNLLDEALGLTPQAVARRDQEIADYQRKVRETLNATRNAAANAKLGSLSYASPFSMNMAALSRSAYRTLPPLARSRAYSNDYQSMVSREEGSKKSAYENSFQNRYLSSEIKDGSYRKKAEDMVVAEKAAMRLQKRQDELLKQGRLIQRQVRYGNFGGQFVHAYKENEGMIRGAGAMAGRGATYGGAAVAGLAASGFTGTVEGERFARELRVLSLEIAASFKPLMDATTDFVRRIRRNLQSMNQSDQDRLQTAGLTAFGAYAGYRVGRFAGPVGGAVGAGVGAAVGLHEGNLLAADRERAERRAKHADLDNMDPQEALVEIERRRESLRQKNEDDKKNLSVYGRIRYNMENEDAYRKERSDLANRAFEIKQATEIERKKKAGEELTDAEKEREKTNPAANQNRRQLMITEGTGPAAAGSTFWALQEDLLRTMAADTKVTNEILTRMDQNLQELNRPGR